MSIQILCLFDNYFSYWVVRILYAFKIESIIMYMVCTFFPPILSVIFSISWWCPLINFDEVLYIWIFSFVPRVFSVSSKNLLLNPRWWRFASVFSSRSFIVFDLTLRFFLVIFKMCIGYETGVQFHSFTCGYTIGKTLHFSERPFFHYWGVLVPFSKINWS